MQETWFPSLSWKNPLEKGMATNSNILMCEIPWTEEMLGYSPWGCKSVGHDLVTKQQIQHNDLIDVYAAKPQICR